MLKILIALLTLAPLFANANIEKSSLEVRHQALIEAVIYDLCGAGRIVEIENTKTEVAVDQGIRDAVFETRVVLRVRVGRYKYNESELLVSSNYADHYDHSTKQWGAYSVNWVSPKSGKCYLDIKSL